jgi:hypothetical protein
VYDAFPPALAVSTTASAHVLYWTTPATDPAQGLQLLWWTSPLTPEVVATGGNDVNLPQVIGIATSAPDAANPAGKPHVVFTQTLASGGTEVVYATRTGPSQWTTVSIVQDSSIGDNPCAESSPTSAAPTCSYDYTIHQPIGIAASQSGDARVFFAARHFQGTLTAQCVPATSAPECMWNQEGFGPETDTLSVAWITGSSVSTTDLATTHEPSAATIAVDAAGAMHIALYDAVTVPGTTTFSTRYLRIGLAGQ